MEKESECSYRAPPLGAQHDHKISDMEDYASALSYVLFGGANGLRQLPLFSHIETDQQVVYVSATVLAEEADLAWVAQKPFGGTRAPDGSGFPGRAEPMVGAV